MTDGYQVAAVYADKLSGREGPFQLAHGLVSDQGVVRGVDLQVILHALYIQDLGEVDAEEFAVGFDKKVVAGGEGRMAARWWGFFAGQGIETPIEQFVHCLGESFEGDGF